MADPPDILRQNETPPLDHRFAISAAENRNILIGATVLFLGGGLAVDVLESGEKYARWIMGDSLFLYLLGAMALVGVLAASYQAWVSARELKRIAAGEYLERWIYTPEQWEVFKAMEGKIQSGKSRTILVILVVLFGILGLAAGVLAALNKSPWWTPLVWLPAGVGIGVGLWAVFILPFKILSGTYNRILNRKGLEHEVIFTENGVYSTGRYFQVNDAGYDRISSGISDNLPRGVSAPNIDRSFFVRAAKRGRGHGDYGSHGVSHAQLYPMPTDRYEQALALTEVYSKE